MVQPVTTKECSEKPATHKTVIYETLLPSDEKLFDFASALIPQLSAGSSSSLDKWQFTSEAELRESLGTAAQTQIAQDTDCQFVIDTISHACPHLSPSDILYICYLYALLLIRNRELEKLSRREEREQWILEMNKVVSNLKSQATWLLTSNIMSGVLGIVSGSSLIVGHLFGNNIMEGLKLVTSRFDGMNRDQFFKGVQKITTVMGDMQKSTGQIQNTFAESHRHRHQQFSDIGRMDAEEATRVMDDLNQDRKTNENWITHFLQTEYETTRTIYS